MRRVTIAEGYDDPLRALAADVVRQALEDAVRPKAPYVNNNTRRDDDARTQSREWLQGGEGLEFWAQAAGVDPDAVIEWWRREEAALNPVAA